MGLNTVGQRYELRDEIDSGGMGTVWRAFDVVLDREVAVKRISPDLITTAGDVDVLAKRFQREARVTARIQHHGVPQVYDAGLDHGLAELYLVMELVHGMSLRAFIDPGEPLPVSWAAAFGAQIATVLSHAHAVPIVHRDLKPENVLVSEDGAAKVLDFGIAAVLRPEGTQLTATGSPIGTALYMSPEQVKGGQVGPHSDLYALGCVLYELVAGYPVFGGDDDLERWNRHVKAIPMPLQELRADVPAGMDRLVLDLLAKTPEERPADAYEVYEQLLPFLPAPGSTPRITGTATSEMPDPTLVFRRPNAPCRRPEPEPTSTAEQPPDVAAGTSNLELREVIKQAVRRSDVLLEDELFAQAADVLAEAISTVGEGLGLENPRVLALRLRRAAILVVGGEYRLARPEFDALESAFSRSEGPTSDHTVQCLRQSAYCRAELGQIDEAIRRFNEVLQRISRCGDGTNTALAVRRNIGELQLAQNDAIAADRTLQALYNDLLVLRGKNHEETENVVRLLERIDPET